MISLRTGLVILTSVSLCGYIVLILTICSTRKLRTTSNQLIVILGIADVLNLATSLLSTFAGRLTNDVTHMYCILIYTPPYFFALSSRNLFVLVALEKYIRVFYPLRYEILITNTKIGIATLLCFLTSLLISTLPLFGVNNIAPHEAMKVPWRFKGCYGHIVFRGEFIITIHSYISFDIIVCLFLYIRVLLIARKQARQIRAMAIPVALSSTNEGSISDKHISCISARNSGKFGSIDPYFCTCSAYL